MLDEQARVLYVGKARNLKARVSNYARPTGHSSRIARMISETSQMMFLTTQTETEALLLEQNLIKQLKPRYNVLLRDDKSFPNILVTTEHEFPQIKKHRGAKKEKGAYYGPFASAGAVNKSLNQLQRVFQLRNCSDAMFETRTRPCLQYQIKRCSGPCVGRISPSEYRVSVKDAQRFLSGKSTEIQESLAAQMAQASEAMEFERAAALRDRIRAMTQVQTNQGINPRTVSEADVIAIHIEGAQACVQVFFIRANQNWGNRDFYPRISADHSHAEVLEAFVGQFYSSKEAPRQLILSHDIENADLVSAALSEEAGRKVELIYPQRGEKFELVSGALRNAKESLALRMSETATQAKLLRGIAEAFDLDEAPQRIEVFDNSHIQGAHAVGAMIVSGPEGFLKNQYRKFNIRGDDLTPGDTLHTEGRQISAEDIEHFANFTGDTFYAHMDDAAAKRNPFFPGKVAHGYLLLSFAAGLFVDPDEGPVLANTGLDRLKFAKPVVAGDSIHVALTVKQKTRRTAEYGEVRWHVQIHNQDKDLVAEYELLTMNAYTADHQ